MTMPADHAPERSTAAEVARLLRQMQQAARPDAISQEIAKTASHRIITLCGGYMTDEPFRLAKQFNLTRYEARVAEALFSRPGRTLTKDALMNALYFDRVGKDEPEVKIVDIWVCKLRKKLANTPYKIETVHAQGYRGAMDTAP